MESADMELELGHRSSPTIRSTLALVRADLRAREVYDGVTYGRLESIGMLLFPPVLGVVLYRVSHWLYYRRLRLLAWMCWVLQQMLTGMDITPSSEIGAGLVVTHSAGTTISARLGCNVVLHGRCGVGGRVTANPDDASRNGLPLVADGVTIGPGALVLGAIHVGAHAFVTAGALVIKDVPAGMAAVGAPAVNVPREDLDWSGARGQESTP